MLGYPKCPLIGRYNKGDYQIGDIVKHLEFKLNFNEDIHGYQCGLHAVAVPEFLTGILRNIPEVIPYNKPKNMKSEPDVHLTHHLPQATVSLNWIVSMGPMGKGTALFTQIFSTTSTIHMCSRKRCSLGKNSNGLPTIYPSWPICQNIQDCKMKKSSEASA